MSPEDDLRLRFIEAAGHATQTFGFGRIVGQIFAHVYFSPTPQSLDDLTAGLGISKGSASMVVRQLEQWSALRRVWVKGSRRAYYEATTDFGRILRKMMVDMVGRTMETSDSLLDEAEHLVGPKHRGARASAEKDFMRQRLEALRSFRARARWLWESPPIRMLLK